MGVRWRACVAVAAMTLLAAAGTGDAAPTSQVITLTGPPNSSVLVTTTTPLTPTATPWDTLGGPPAGKLAHRYLGYAITRAGSAEVLVGALRSGGVEQAMGAGLLPWTMRFGSARGTALQPGRYRIILLGSSRVQLKTDQRHGALRWRTSAPERVLYRVGHPSSAALDQPLLLSKRIGITVGPTSYVLMGMAGSNSLNVASVDNFCLTSPGALSCVGGYPDQNVGTEQQPLFLPRTGSSSVGTGDGGGYAGTAFQPGEVPRGAYDALFFSTGQASGPQPWYVLFALS